MHAAEQTQRSQIEETNKSLIRRLRNRRRDSKDNLTVVTKLKLNLQTSPKVRMITLMTKVWNTIGIWDKKSVVAVTSFTWEKRNSVTRFSKGRMTVRNLLTNHRPDKSIQTMSAWTYLLKPKVEDLLQTCAWRARHNQVRPLHTIDIMRVVSSKAHLKSDDKRAQS